MNNYKMWNTWLDDNTAGKDVWVTVNHRLNTSQQCDAVTKKANFILKCINRSAECIAQEVIVPFQSALVRPQLQFWVQFWVPHFKKDVDKLETVQRRATKMIKGK